VVHSWLGNLPQEWVRARDGEDAWSPFDIVGHLIHGEKTDWIPRAKIILSDRETLSLLKTVPSDDSTGRHVRLELPELLAVASEVRFHQCLRPR